MFSFTESMKRERDIELKRIIYLNLKLEAWSNADVLLVGNTGELLGGNLKKVSALSRETNSTVTSSTVALN